MTKDKMNPIEETAYLNHLKALKGRIAADSAKEDVEYFAAIRERAKADDAEDEAYFASLTAKEPQEGHYDAIRRMEAETVSMTPTEFFKEIGGCK